MLKCQYGVETLKKNSYSCFYCTATYSLYRLNLCVLNVWQIALKSAHAQFQGYCHRSNKQIAACKTSPFTCACVWQSCVFLVGIKITINGALWEEINLLRNWGSMICPHIHFKGSGDSMNIVYQLQKISHFIYFIFILCILEIFTLNHSSTLQYISNSLTRKLTCKITFHILLSLLRQWNLLHLIVETENRILWFNTQPAWSFSVFAYRKLA